MQFHAEVRDLTSDGRGVISTPEGLTCFVAGVWLGEQGTFRLLKTTGKIASAELVELEQPSPHRRSAPCEFHGHTKKHCGGCAWQYINYEAQLAAKQQRVERALTRLQSDVSILPIQPSTDEFNYRNRAQFKTNGYGIGFEAANTNELVEISDCIVLTEKNRQTLSDLRSSLPNNEWRPKSGGRGRNKKQAWVSLDIDEDISVDKVSVNQRLPFKQGNTAQNAYMQEWVARHFGALPQGQTVLELFCGSGNFTEVIAQNNCKSIIAAEIDTQAVTKLNNRNLLNTQAICCNLFAKDSLDFVVRQANDAETVLLDPPRDGLKTIGTVCEYLRKLERVFYISCDLATFSRDAKILLEMGFRFDEVQPVDLFPQTPHVEILAKLNKR